MLHSTKGKYVIHWLVKGYNLIVSGLFVKIRLHLQRLINCECIEAFNLPTALALKD